MNVVNGDKEKMQTIIIVLKVILLYSSYIIVTSKKLLKHVKYYINSAVISINRIQNKNFFTFVFISIFIFIYDLIYKCKKY